MKGKWIEVRPGRWKFDMGQGENPKRERRMKAVDLAHVSMGLPREGGDIDYKKLGIDCVKSGLKKGQPILRRGLQDIKNVEAYSNGRYQFDYRNDRATPFEAPR